MMRKGEANVGVRFSVCPSECLVEQDHFPGRNVTPSLIADKTWIKRGHLLIFTPPQRRQVVTIHRVEGENVKF